jgi:hypothetical protein
MCGSNYTSNSLPCDITRISNEDFDIYIKRNQILIVVDKRSEKPIVYGNLKTALHYLSPTDL